MSSHQSGSGMNLYKLGLDMQMLIAFATDVSGNLGTFLIIDNIDGYKYDLHEVSVF